MRLTRDGSAAMNWRSTAMPSSVCPCRTSSVPSAARASGKSGTAWRRIAMACRVLTGLDELGRQRHAGAAVRIAIHDRRPQGDGVRVLRVSSHGSNREPCEDRHRQAGRGVAERWPSVAADSAATGRRRPQAWQAPRAADTCGARRPTSLRIGMMLEVGASVRKNAAARKPIFGQRRAPRRCRRATPSTRAAAGRTSRRASGRGSP